MSAKISSEAASLWLICFLTVVLLASACGSGAADGSDDSVGSGAIPSGTGTLSTDPPTRESLSPTVVSVARAITDRHGPADGLWALVSALDVGYDVDQIASSALVGALDLDGTIRIDGSAVTPTGTVAGIISVPDEDGSDEGAQAQYAPLPTAQSGTLVLVAYAQEPGPYDRADLLFDLLDGARTLAPPIFEAPPVESGFDLFESDETAVAALIMALASSGYSIRQITEALTLQTALGLGTIGESDRSLLGACPALFDPSTGERINPDRPRGTAFCAEPVTGLFAPPTPAPEPAAPAEEADAGPGQLTWSGEVSVTGYEDRRLYEDPTVIITINRVEGTDDYQGEFLLEIAGPFGEACSQANTYHFVGQGTASASSPPAQIVMTGRQTESYVLGDCTAEWAHLAEERTDEKEETILLSLTDEGISGLWGGGALTEFLLPSD